MTGEPETAPRPTPAALRVLVLEDSPLDVELEMAVLEEAGYACTWERVQTRADFLARLERSEYDLIFADYNLPNFDGLSALALARERELETPFILISGTLGEERAIESLRAGATDYVIKGRLPRLAPVVERALREREERRGRQRAEVARHQEAEISSALARVGRELIASLDASVLLDRLCQVTTEVLGCDFSHTVLWEREGDVLVPVAGYGDTMEQWESIRALRIPRAAVEDLVALAEREDLAHVEAAQNSMAASIAAEFGTTVMLCMALRREGEMFGFQVVGYRGRLEPFSAQQERIARGIAHLASLALENARLVADLDRANSIKSDFIATMSHELRTPLHAIMGYTDLVIDGEFGPLTAEQLDALGHARRSSADLLDIVSATLDLSRLEKGDLPVHEKEVHLPELLSQLEAETAAVWEKPGVRLVWDVADVPLLRTDPVKLKVVVKNLVANAIKFTERGDVTVTVRAGKGGVALEVADSGIGIAPQHLELIFEPFRQVEAYLTRRHGGVGLGLYIVRRMLDALGGTISVESEVDRGSTFRVWLPARARRARSSAHRRSWAA